MSDQEIKEKLDQFSDLSKLRIGQNFNETIGVRRALLHVPIKKPSRQDFIRVHQDENMRLPVSMIDLKDEGEMFLVHPELAQQIPGEIVPKILTTAINRQGVLFLWPITMDLNDERTRKNHWNESARAAAELATTKWIRVASNLSLGAYDTFVATGSLPEPQWPELTFEAILRIAFKDNYISSADHPVIKRLLGLQ
jgi:hypothetical protein